MAPMRPIDGFPGSRSPHIGSMCGFSLSRLFLAKAWACEGAALSAGSHALP